MKNVLRRSQKNAWEWSKIGQGWPRTWWLDFIRPIGEYFSPGLGHHRNFIYLFYYWLISFPNWLEIF